MCVAVTEGIIPAPTPIILFFIFSSSLEPVKTHKATD
jgi:hypothetical protein